MASISPYTGVLGKRLAKHLLRRATYNQNQTSIDNFSNLTGKQAVEALFNIPNLNLTEPIDPENLTPFINSGVEPVSSDFFLTRHIISWWMEEARQDTSIAHKLSFFLHSVFIVNADAGQARQFFDYLNLFRQTAARYTNGSFSMDSIQNLALKMVTDNVMLRYLNGNDNVDTSPNENFAREFFELFTIGKGPQIGPGDYTTYTEADIGEAAKVLTGWTNQNRPLGQGGNPLYTDPQTGIQRGKARFNQHDTTDKTFSPAFNSTTITAATDTNDMWRELEDFVEMIFLQDATAKNICRKLYRYFVSSNITAEIESDIINPLAATLIQNDYQISFALKQLLMSQHFYDLDDSDNSNEIIGSLLKSPFELLYHTISFFQIAPPDYLTDTDNHFNNWYRRTVANVITTQGGMFFFFPDSVAGYPAYYQEPGYSRNWFNGSTLIARYKQAEILLSGTRVLQGGTNGGVAFEIVPFIKNSGAISDPANASILVNELIDYLFPETPLADRAAYFLDVFLDDLSPINWSFEWANYLNTDDDSAVKIPLETLFKALISSQEFGLM
ncbi:MAG: DUF1800 family protein [Saprospiraceae bacterium]